MNLCYPCQKHAQGKTGEERVKALAEIRELILAGNVTRGRHTLLKKREAEEKPDTEPEIGAVPVPTRVKNLLKAGADTITLYFTSDTDRALLRAITEQAEQYRRTVDQQILWLCQNELLNQEAEIMSHGV